MPAPASGPGRRPQPSARGAASSSSSMPSARPPRAASTWVSGTSMPHSSGELASTDGAVGIVAVAIRRGCRLPPGRTTSAQTRIARTRSRWTRSAVDHGMSSATDHTQAEPDLHRPPTAAAHPEKNSDVGRHQTEQRTPSMAAKKVQSVDHVGARQEPDQQRSGASHGQARRGLADRLEPRRRLRWPRPSGSRPRLMPIKPGMNARKSLTDIDTKPNTPMALAAKRVETIGNAPSSRPPKQGAADRADAADDRHHRDRQRDGEREVSASERPAGEVRRRRRRWRRTARTRRPWWR